MSLIFDALKKSQLESHPVKDKIVLPTHPIIPDSHFLSKRTVALLSLFVLSAGLLFFLRFTKKPDALPTPGSIESAQKSSHANSVETLEKQALLHFQDKKWELSRGLWEKMILLSPTDPSIYNNLGLTLRRLGRNAEAKESYQKALALNANYPEANNNLGVLLLEERDLDKAQSHFEAALSFEKNYADAHLHLALLLERRGNYKKARQHYRAFLDCAKDADKDLRQRVKIKLVLLEST